ncbi:hypothetical protein H5410_002320, partial [Solanum commersonii]
FHCQTMSLIKMKYGVSTKMTHFHEQDHGLDAGCYFHFWNMLQGQTDLNDHTPADLRSAIEEVFLADNGVVEMLMFRVDFPSSGSIYFQVGFINKKLDSKQFETLHSCRDNGLALCGGTSLRQMKYGVSTKITRFHEQDYAWIRRGMLFPFLEHGLTDLNDSTPADLRSAIEEAFLADNGVVEMLMVDIKQFETLHSCLVLCGVPSLRQIKMMVAFSESYSLSGWMKPLLNIILSRPLPSSVKCYSLSDDETFEVLLICYVEFEYLVYFADKVTGSITDLERIADKSLVVVKCARSIIVWICHRLGLFTFKLDLLTKRLISNILKLLVLARTMLWLCVEDHL